MQSELIFLKLVYFVRMPRLVTVSIAVEKSNFSSRFDFPITAVHKK